MGRDVSKRIAKYDPGNEYAINYMWGTVGIGYNVKKVKEALGTDKIDSWDVFFNPENAGQARRIAASTCSIRRPTSSRPTLNYLGLDPEQQVAPTISPRPRRRC